MQCFLVKKFVCTWLLHYLSNLAIFSHNFINYSIYFLTLKWMAKWSIITQWTLTPPPVRTTNSVFKSKRAVYFYRFLSALSDRTGGIHITLKFGYVFLLFIIQKIVDLVKLSYQKKEHSKINVLVPFFMGNHRQQLKCKWTEAEFTFKICSHKSQIYHETEWMFGARGTRGAVIVLELLASVLRYMYFKVHGLVSISCNYK